MPLNSIFRKCLLTNLIIKIIKIIIDYDVINDDVDDDKYSS